MCVLLCNMCKGDHGTGGNPLVMVTAKGLETLIQFSETRSCTQLTEYLKGRQNATPIGKVSVHKKCRRDFTDKTRSFSVNPENTDDVPPCSKRMRSDEVAFNFKGDCFLCGKNASIDLRRPDRTQVRRVTTLPMRDKLLERCKVRADLWAFNVQKCLLSCFDLVAAEAVYHAACLSMFLGETDENPLEKKSQGRAPNIQMQRAFEALCVWLESGGGTELYTLSELHTKMDELSVGSELYSIKRLKQVLEERYGECICLSEVEGRNNVVCFRDVAK